MINTLCDRVNLSLIAMSTHADWLKAIEDQWCDPSNFIIKSWHSSNGQILPNTTVAGDVNVLLPLGDAVTAINAANRRGDDISFVNIQVTLDFNHIVPPANQPCVLPVEFYIELPQSVVQTMNGAGNVTAHTTFAGPSDIRLSGKGCFKNICYDSDSSKADDYTRRACFQCDKGRY